LGQQILSGQHLSSDEYGPHGQAYFRLIVAHVGEDGLEIGYDLHALAVIAYQRPRADTSGIACFSDFDFTFGGSNTDASKGNVAPLAGRA